MLVIFIQYCFCMLKLVSFDCDSFMYKSVIIIFLFSFRSWGHTGEGSLVVVLLLLQRLLWDTFGVQWCVWKCAFG